MTSPTDKRNQGRKMPPLIAAGSLFTLALLVFWGLGCSLADPQICTLAATLCWLPGMGSLFIIYRTAHTPMAIPGILGGVLLRMAIPLLGMIVLAQQYTHSELNQVFGTVVAYYLATLMVDTLLTVWLVKALKPMTQPTTESIAREVAHG